MCHDSNVGSWRWETRTITGRGGSGQSKTYNFEAGEGGLKTWPLGFVYNYGGGQGGRNRIRNSEREEEGQGLMREKEWKSTLKGNQLGAVHKFHGFPALERLSSAIRDGPFICLRLFVSCDLLSVKRYEMEGQDDGRRRSGRRPLGTFRGSRNNWWWSCARKDDDEKRNTFGEEHTGTSPPSS